MRVNDVMTRNPAVCTATSSAQTAADLMKKHNTGMIPVVDDAYSRTLVGVVTDRDLCLAVVAAAREPMQVWVRDCMTPDPVFCAPEDKVEVALAVMQKHQVRRVPVVDVHKTVHGVVSIGDLVRHNAVGNGELFSALKKIFAPKTRAAKKAA
ncbi:MAG TPA: CBS domain-containing protein [Terriglobales bacterium]|nr:CBS domain-containing protein [Terriglobales bacterium]